MDVSIVCKLNQALIIVALLAPFACAPVARAAVITRCNETAIDNAVASGAAIFGVNCTITLTKTLNIPISRFGTITQIRANGFAVTLDGGHRIGVINVPRNAALSLENVTVQNGRTSSSTGGGISNAGTVSVNACAFLGNTNAILNTGNLSVTSTAFHGNAAPSGGAILHSGGQAYIAYSSFGASGMPSSGNGGGQAGGAIYVSGTTAEIDHSVFYYNLATQGGAIYAYLSTLTLTGDYFNGNTTNPGGAGGAIANLGSSITITNTSGGGFQSNSALNSSTTRGLGGAIYNAGVETSVCGTFWLPGFQAPSLTLNAVALFNNSAGSGGAVYSLGNGGGVISGSGTNPGSVIKVVYSYFLQNFAGPFNATCCTDFPIGTAIANEGNGQLTISGSTFQESSDEAAGKIHSTGSLSVSDSTFFACCTTATIDNNGTATVKYSTFLGGFHINSIPPVGTFNFSGTVFVSSQDSCEPFRPITDGGYNLETGNSCGFSAANNSLSNTDPKIDPTSFGSNGGATPTFALPTGSPAIDQIPDGTLGCGVLGDPGAFDQRGVSRPQGLKCDIGAIEHLFSNLPASGNSCNGIYNKTFPGDITVLPGQSCVFLGGGVTGNVQVKGGSFEVRYATVGGGVEIDHGSSFSIGPSASIGGSLEIHNLDQGAAQNLVCGATIQGFLDVHNNDDAVVIGSQDSASCPGNTIGGSVEVHNNDAATNIDGNSITGDLTDHNNSGPAQIFNNLIKGALECHQNSSISGGLDVAAQKRGQCAQF